MRAVAGVVSQWVTPLELRKLPNLQAATRLGCQTKPNHQHFQLSSLCLSRPSLKHESAPDIVGVDSHSFHSLPAIFMSCS